MNTSKNIYKPDSTRLKSWDYTNPWWYYVTICTKNHKECFGEIVGSKMKLNDLGQLVNEYWLNIPSHYPEAELDDFIIMPNHVHGIIILKLLSIVETGHAPSLHSLGNIVGSFKSGVSKWAHQNGFKDFQWQQRFYDRIIRNKKELFQIRKYISQNPLRWEIEKGFPNNIDIS